MRGMGSDLFRRTRNSFWPRATAVVRATFAVPLKGAEPVPIQKATACWDDSAGIRRTHVNPIRVMVVDDSVVVRKIVTDVLSADPDIEVVGTAVNGKIGVGKLDQLKPDLVTMDIEMPEMNGIEAVRAIRGMRGRVPIVMFSTLTERGAS